MTILLRLEPFSARSRKGIFVPSTLRIEKGKTASKTISTDRMYIPRWGKNCLQKTEMFAACKHAFCLLSPPKLLNSLPKKRAGMWKIEPIALGIEIVFVC